MTLEQRKRMNNATIYNLLRGFKTEMILYMMICSTSKTAIKRISTYHTRLRHVAITITGKDLLNMGLTPGPLFSKIIQAVLEAKLNGRVITREDEFAYVKKTIKKQGVDAAIADLSPTMPV
jgi:tRNA nucleotidyltransferase (CCA-adding enzyme)